jgi:1,4-dihydroxy-2-naphthoate octaprenyltransferase
MAIFPLSCLQFAMLLMIEFPDAEGDRLVGKDTLVVRLGADRAAKLYNAVLLIAYAALPFLIWAGLPVQVGILILFTAPFALWQTWRMAHGAYANPAAWNSLAFISVFLLIGTALLECLGFTVLIGLT